MRLALDPGHTRLGRGPGVDLAFSDQSLHRTHALIIRDGSHLSMHAAQPDIDSIRVNGSPLAVPEHELHDGDVVRLGERSFQVSIERTRLHRRV